MKTTTQTIGLIPERAGRSDIVEERKHEEPHDIDEVPVEGDIREGRVVFGREALREKLAQEAPDDEQDAYGHMHTVESGDQKEARAVDAAGVEPEAFVVEVPPLVALDADEEGAEQDGDEEPSEAGFALGDGDFGEVEGEAAGDEENGVDGGEEDGELRNTFAARPGVAGLPGEADFRPAENEIAAEEAGEKHALGDQEHDHAEFGDGGRCAGMGVGIVGQGCAGHGVFCVF